MHIQEGETVNYVDDIRTRRVGGDRQVAGRPRRGHRDPAKCSSTTMPRKNPRRQLPFDVKVVKYFRTLKSSGQPGEETRPRPAPAALVSQGAAAGTGTDTDSKVDLASAYVELLDKQDGHALGTYLVSQELRPQHVDVDGKTYDIRSLQAHYKPYSMHLDDIIVENYPGTEIPKDYRAKVQLVDPNRRNEDRRVEIWMNHPLRFAGETFYQSGYERNEGEATKLSVVTNTGWMLPYVACMLVVVGLVAHFSFVLSVSGDGTWPDATPRPNSRVERPTDAELRAEQRRAAEVIPPLDVPESCSPAAVVLVFAVRGAVGQDELACRCAEAEGDVMAYTSSASCR